MQYTDPLSPAHHSNSLATDPDSDKLVACRARVGVNCVYV